MAGFNTMYGKSYNLYNMVDIYFRVSEYSLRNIRIQTSICAHTHTHLYILTFTQ